MSTTIRRNNIKKISALVAGMALCTRYRDDGMDATNSRLTADEVMALAPRFENVYLRDDGCLSIGICSHVDFVTCYPTQDVGRRLLTAEAFRRYFPEAGVAS